MPKKNKHPKSKTTIKIKLEIIRTKPKSKDEGGITESTKLKSAKLFLWTFAIASIVQYVTVFYAGYIFFTKSEPSKYIFAVTAIILFKFLKKYLQKRAQVLGISTPLPSRSGTSKVINGLIRIIIQWILGDF